MCWRVAVAPLRIDGRIAALDAQAKAKANLTLAGKIFTLYEAMKEQFREVLNSAWSVSVLDFVFEQPVFRNNQLPARTEIPRQSAMRFTRRLHEAGLLRLLEEAAGRRPALYSFEPLLALVRNA